MRTLLLGFALASASVLAGNNAAWNKSGGSLSTSPITLNVQSTASSTYTVRVPQVGDIYVSQAADAEVDTQLTVNILRFAEQSN